MHVRRDKICDGSFSAKVPTKIWHNMGWLFHEVTRVGAGSGDMPRTELSAVQLWQDTSEALGEHGSKLAPGILTGFRKG